VLKHWTILLGLVALAVTVRPAWADESAAGTDCAGHFTIEGNFLSGKKYTTWAEFAAVSKADAYSRIYATIAKDGWNITSSDKDGGVISASQSVMGGKGATAPMTIVVEAAAGGGSKATATFRIGGGQMTKEASVKEKLCAYLRSASST
jgi:hypothetical protein